MKRSKARQVANHTESAGITAAECREVDVLPGGRPESTSRGWNQACLSCEFSKIQV